LWPHPSEIWGDLSNRAKEALLGADLVAAEDTRRTLKLLNHIGAKKPLLRCDEEKEAIATQKILTSLKKGESVALVSDAGTPAISDPGARLVDQVHRLGFRVVPIPGPSAPITALAASGFSGAPFLFLGFLARKGGDRRYQMNRIEQGEETIVFFESPHRFPYTLSDLAEQIPDRMIFVGREMTKMNEETYRGVPRDASDHFSKKTIRGEFTIVVAPLSKKEIRRHRRETSTIKNR